jgi:hypothetical protein
MRVRLLDMRGRSLLVEHIATDRQTVGLNGIPAGVYLLEVTDQEGRRAVQKVLLQ